MSYDRELVKKIADAMDDPKYQQCTGSLGRKNEDGTCCHCAEGVVLDVLGIPYTVRDDGTLKFTYHGYTYVTNMPMSVTQDYWLPFSFGTLSMLNDRDRLTLPQIGQWIRDKYLNV